MKNLLELLKCMYDVVLLDGTSCMLVSDSIALSSMVESTILIAESKKTKTNDLNKVKKLIKDVNGKILGVIINKVKIKNNKYYGKGYGYYYGKEDIKVLENLKEKHKEISLNEIIKKAKQNIEIDLLNEKDGIIDIEEDKETLSLENIDDTDINNKINFEMSNIKNGLWR